MGNDRLVSERHPGHHGFATATLLAVSERSRPARQLDAALLGRAWFGRAETDIGGAALDAIFTAAAVPNAPRIPALYLGADARETPERSCPADPAARAGFTLAGLAPQARFTAHQLGGCAIECTSMLTR